MVEQRRPTVLGLAMLLGAAAAAATAIAGPSLTRSAPARAAVEVLTVLVAARAAWLLFGRARASGGRGRDLTLAWAVGLFALVEGTASLLPTIVSPLQVDGDLLRAEAVARLLIAAVLAAAALAPVHIIDRAGRRTAYAMGSGLLAVAVALTLIVALSPANATAASPPAYLAAALLAVLAGAALAWRAVRDGSELDAWIAAAVVLLGGAHLDAGLGPVLAPDWLTTGDLLRCVAALTLLAGAVRQPGTYLGATARRAVAQERRRIARDLHDGLSQELAYIAAHAPLVAARSAEPAAAKIAEAAACALDESRIVIASLAQESREPLGLALARAAERIVARAGKVIRVDLQADVEVEQAVRSDLLRIVMEATTNAVRHSGASEVSLSLTGGEPLVLRIADDGVGFQPGGAGPELYSGFGLTSMQERAERAGGLLHVRSDPGRGTVVEVSIA
jgi:signal transduction histidine kinase